MRVLLVDADEPGGEMVRDVLAEPPTLAGVEQVATLSAAISALTQSDYDAVLLDLVLPDASGPQCIETLRLNAAHVAIVAFSDADDEQVALACLQAGAQDCISRRHARSRRLHRILRFAIARAKGFYSRSRAEQLRALTPDMLDALKDAIICTEADGTVLSLNRRAQAELGVHSEQKLEPPLSDLIRQQPIVARAPGGETLRLQDVMLPVTGGRWVRYAVSGVGVPVNGRVQQLWWLLRRRDDEPAPGEGAGGADGASVRLSARELDVLRRIASGRAIKELAGDLAISEKTVATYVARIRRKTGLSNAAEMTRYAMHKGLVD